MSRAPVWRLIVAAVVVGPAAITASMAAAQETGQPVADRLNVFLACDGRGCDPAAYQSRITWVNWVNDSADADVRASMSSQPAARGGYEYRIDFAVADSVGAASDQLFFVSSSTDTEQDELAGISTVLAIGFARYSTIAGFREFVAVRPVTQGGIDPAERVVAPQQVDDPWKLWVFTVGGSANVSGTETRKTRRFMGNFSASRTTPTWKVSFSGRGTINVQEIERSDGSIFENDQREGIFSTGVTYALADHWSLDLSSLSARLPRFNQRFRTDLTPGIEYSVFPYEEATRRTLTLRYTFAFTYREYEELTIYGKMEEAPVEQAIQMRGTMRQPWGDASVTGTVSHLLDDLDKHNIALRGSLGFRIVRGLTFDVGGDVSWVTDQVYLSAGGVTDEEALLRLRTRGSAFNKGLNFGLSYQFGSIYNNTVNNRFPGVGVGGGAGGGAGRGGGRGGGGGGGP